MRTQMRRKSNEYEFYRDKIFKLIQLIPRCSSNKLWAENENIYQFIQ